MDTAVTALFFIGVLALAAAALLAPVYVLYKVVQQQWPQWCPAPAWRFALYCLPGSLGYGWWRDQQNGWLQLTSDLLVGVSVSCLFLLPLTMALAWYSAPPGRQHKNAQQGPKQ